MPGADSDFDLDGGWSASATAWLGILERGDPNRKLLLDRAMLAEVGDVAGLRVLDLGCGDGRFSRMLAERGAVCIGLDVIDAFVTAATSKAGESERYVRGSGEMLPFVDGSFDLVIAYLSLIDIPDFRSAIRESARVLRPGGRLVVCGISNLHSAAHGWTRDADRRRLHVAVDRYLEERPVVLEWSGMRILNWHRPLSAYIKAYLDAGLSLRRFLEPMPADDSLRDDPEFEDWYRVPNFDIQVWQK